MDLILANPSIFGLYPNETKEIQMLSPAIPYHSHTGIVFHSDSEQWKPAVNSAIARLHEQGLMI